MSISTYQLLCSKEILKQITTLLKNDNLLEKISSEYYQIINSDIQVDYTWSLISTSLLISENLDKYDKVYTYFSDKTKDLIFEKLMLSERTYINSEIFGPCLLDGKNNVVASFNDYIEFVPNDNHDAFDDEFFDKYDLFLKEVNEIRNRVLIEGEHGCNDAIFDGNFINIDKLIKRIRNALAHSNYEVIDNNYLRLYHYNRKTKKLDFNVIMDSDIVVLIVDELNEIASQKYIDFMYSYFDEFDTDKFNCELTEEDYLKYIMSFDLFDSSIAEEILLSFKEYYKDKNESKSFEKIKVIKNLIYDKIRPSYSAGIIINDYLYCDNSGKITSDELYVKYGFYEYLNSIYYDAFDKNNTDKIYLENKLKFLILSFLNCVLLTGYNLNENTQIDEINFNGMNIDKEILKKFLIKNKLNAQMVSKTLEQELEKTEKDILRTNESINKKKKIIEENKISNDYYLVKLPNEINELTIKNETNKNNYQVLQDKIRNIKEQGCMYCYDKNLTKYIFSSLRNSLAHGYVSFPTNIDFNNITDMNICFEDYNPSNKQEKTFRGTMKLLHLLESLTSHEYIDNVFGLDNIKNNHKILKKIK